MDVSGCNHFSQGDLYASDYVSWRIAGMFDSQFWKLIKYVLHSWQSGHSLCWHEVSVSVENGYICSLPRNFIKLSLKNHMGWHENLFGFSHLDADTWNLSLIHCQSKWQLDFEALECFCDWWCFRIGESLDDLDPWVVRYAGGGEGEEVRKLWLVAPPKGGDRAGLNILPSKYTLEIIKINLDARSLIQCLCLEWSEGMKIQR